MSSRQDKLEAMLSTDPSDQTCRYMLAMEYDKLGDTTRALEQFDALMQSDRPYVPAFLMAGQLLQRLSRVDEARRCFAEGIEQARAQNNDHAAGEMSQFLADLG